MGGEERVVSARAHYGRVPESLLFSDAADAECRLYAVLTTYDYRQSGECYPGREVVAKRMGWSVRTLDRHFKALEDRGAVERRRQGRGHLNLIVLLADVDESPDLAGHPMSRQNGADESPDRDIASTSLTKENETAAPNGSASSSRKKELHPRANAVTRAWWEHFDPRPSLPFVAAQKIVDGLLHAGWEPEAVVKAAVKSGRTLVRWKVEQELEKANRRPSSFAPGGLNDR